MFDRSSAAAFKRGGATGPGGLPRFEVVLEQNQMVANVRPPLRVLGVAVSVVLLIVCANLTNLLLVRGASRHREIGIRRALGAARGRVVRQLLTEGLVLSTAGAVLGAILAYGAVYVVRMGSVIQVPGRFRTALGPLGTTILPRADEVRIDATVLAFAFGLSLECFSGVRYEHSDLPTREPSRVFAQPQNGTRL
jgi:ABC-type lipoprotein release transport system permease subunit